MRLTLSSRGARRATWRSLFVTMGIASLALAMTSVFAQSPSLNLPEMPTQPLTVIFKDVTKHDQFRLVVQALKQSKRVDSLVMKRAQRGFIEYEGKFFGEPETLVETLTQAVEGRLKIESKQKGEQGLEIVVAPF